MKSKRQFIFSIAPSLGVEAVVGMATGNLNLWIALAVALCAEISVRVFLDRSKQI